MQAIYGGMYNVWKATMKEQHFFWCVLLLNKILLFSQPERINPPKDAPGYDIRSDVWSLGITVVRWLVTMLFLHWCVKHLCIVSVYHVLLMILFFSVD
jgi:hypothetical protein